MSWDDIVKPITAIGAVVGSVITLLLTKGADALIKIKNSNREDRQQVDEQQIAGYKLLYDELKIRIDVLSEQQRRDREELSKCQELHAESEKQNARHEAKLEAQNEKIESQQREIEKLREWRHKVENDHAADVLMQRHNESKSEGVDDV